MAQLETEEIILDLVRLVVGPASVWCSWLPLIQVKKVKNKQTDHNVTGLFLLSTVFNCDHLRFLGYL